MPARFQDVPQFTRNANYAVDVSWGYLEHWLSDHVGESALDLDPDFQREHVWTPEQQVRYVEFILRGGRSGRDIQTNCPGWQRSLKDIGPYVLVDGKQRLTAVRGFLRNDFPIFVGREYGGYRRDFSDKMDMVRTTFRWHVNDLATRAEVLQWYLDLNTGGTVHTDEEISRVRGLLDKERA